MPKDTQSVVMVKDKECKSCVRYRSEQSDGSKVSTSIYLINDAYQALDAPSKINVAISAVK